MQIHHHHNSFMVRIGKDMQLTFIQISLINSGVKNKTFNFPTTKNIKRHNKGKARNKLITKQNLQTHPQNN